MNSVTIRAVPSTVTQADLDLIERFQAAYNAVDKYLRSTLGKDRVVSFTALLSEYHRRYPSWTDGEFLSQVAEMRNFLIHGRTKPNLYLALPTPACVVTLEKIRDRLLSPQRAIPSYQKEVATVSSEETLASVLKQIASNQFSQFPVYDSGKFKGLVTENGITRWFAWHVSSEDSLVELKDVTVRQVLRLEEKRPNWVFVARNTLVDDVKSIFGKNKLLEAVLITNAGSKEERLLGIVTRSDI